MKKNAKKVAAKDSRNEEIKQAVLKFGIEVGATIESLRRAAKVYADIIAKYGAEAEAAFKASYSNVSEGTWEKLRLIGNGDLMPHVLLMSGTMAQRVMRMKKSEQEEFMHDNNGVEVFNEQTRKVEFVKYVDLKPRHERILFDEKGNVRTIEEQKAFVEAAPAVPVKRATVAYCIDGDTLVVNRKCRIGKNELAGILRRMG